MNQRITASAAFITICLLSGCSQSSRTFYHPEQDSTNVLFGRSSSAMVVSAHPIASHIGIAMLKSGGNAADAVLATVAALNVAEPHASGLGGGGFLLYYDAKRDSFTVIDYRERAPENVARRRYYDPFDTLQLFRQHGANAIGTPGAPAGWQAIFDKFCTKHLPELLEPAARVADSGFSLSEKQVAIIQDHTQDILSDSAITSIFMDGGFPPEAGFIVRQPQLAATLRSLAASSLTRLYAPPYADDIVNAVQLRGGVLSRNDLASYTYRIRKPLYGSYNGYEIITLPPPSIGGTAMMEILRIAERTNLKSKNYLSAEYVHCLASASRQALADVAASISDPDFDEQPVSTLLSDEWISTVSRSCEDEPVPAIVPAWENYQTAKTGNTTHVVIVDSAGNLASLTQSINDFYGAGVMAPASGILLNNHMGDFSGDSSRHNSVKPFHRPTSNMAATIVRKNGKPVLVIGSPGGPRIAPTVAQVITAILDGRLSLQDAIKAPRFFPLEHTLFVESRMPAETIQGLRARGWKVNLNGSVNAYFGGVHAIAIDPATGGLTGAADPRRDGAPAGL
ncbi:MAG: gamma-glutamyltransferase [Ignavibacteriales bacterium]|nr:gamma-glutamyltransferase [Ignavibacteriales bacterium]